MDANREGLIKMIHPGRALPAHTHIRKTCDGAARLDQLINELADPVLKRVHGSGLAGKTVNV